MKNIARRLIFLFIVSCVFLCSHLTSVSALDSSYIYFDLNAGNIEITKSKYTGYVFETTNGTTSTKTITGTHLKTNKYYVYQSAEGNKNTSGYVDGVFTIPEYPRVMVGDKMWEDYITNNTNVRDVIAAWENNKGDRRPTKNQILISGYGTTYDLVVDDIWGMKQSRGVLSGSSLAITGANTDNTNVIVRIKDDNRLANVRYYSNSTSSSLTFTSFDGDKSTNGTLTAIGDQTLRDNNSNYRPLNANEDYVKGTDNGNIAANHWDSVIGGTDGNDKVRGLKIEGGTIYSGSTARENCTAIGGGGNGIGNVIINGGRVTAVAETTGTAIGGGIAHTSTGGTSDVVINGGDVYAYNFGQPAYDVISNYGSGATSELKKAARHIAGTAIGGASSILSQGNDKVAKVTITGGNVYAESLGGCGIGAGNSVNVTAGSAIINISGGNVVANSTGKTMVFADGVTEAIINPGVSIGGGSGGINGDGGSAEINISGGTIKTGSIGGGSTRSTKGHNIGYADIKITGGDISGQFIMVKGGTSACTFTMTDGIIHDSDASDSEFARLQKNGGAVYMDDPIGVATISGGTIENCSALNGGAVYMTAGTFNLSGSSNITNCNADGNGGAIYLGQAADTKGTFEMSSGCISHNKASGNGGAIYLDGGNATISGGSLEFNEGQNGGGAYLAGGTLNISLGSFKENEALINGGGAFVSSGNINMSGGTFEGNDAKQNGGGIYLTGGSLSITNGSFDGNTAENNGGGAYVSGGDLALNGDTALFSNNYALNGGGVYLTGGTPNLFKGSLISNIALKDGGGIYIDRQMVEFAPIGEVIISQNKAGYNQLGEEGIYEGRGAGIFIGGTYGVDNASFSVDINSSGSVYITENYAKDFGGGVCINNGHFDVEGTNIIVGKNSSLNGGGVAVLEGNFNLSAGTIGGNDLANDALNGGGVYVSGGDVLITNTGSIANNVASDNGGGVYVANGNVKMIGGLIDSNIAFTKDGGGIYVSATNKDVEVQILSGSIINNKSNTNGGAVSVVGQKEGQETISVTLGVHKNHYDSDGNFVSCNHGDYGHSAYTCPIIEGNEASKKGGAVYITGGKQTKLNIYCLEERNNVSLGDKDRSNFMMVEGGAIVISTCEDNDVNNPSTHGNSIISDSLHVKAGTLDMYGSMNNPKFGSSITVDITSSEDHFNDNRTQSDDEKYYKVQYFENFKESSGIVTGEYTVYQYAEGDSIEISGVVFSHPGYEIIGWFTEPNGGGTMYEVGQNVTFDGVEVKDLIIYAVWQAHSYYVEFDPNIPDGITYEGSMEKVQYTFNTSYELPNNTFVYPGHVFTGWKDQKGNFHSDGQTVINLSSIDGDTIVLSAVWTECSHDENDLDFAIKYSYTAEGNILKKSCSCKGHVESITINARNYTYDKAEHPVILSYSDGVWNEDIILSYIKDGIGVDKPINAGNYEVRLSYGGATAITYFVIYKANQEAPNKPTFTPTDIKDEKNIVINHSPLDPTGKEYDYRISYYSDDEIINLDWSKYNTFSLPITCTNYIIFIRYSEDENHNPSNETKADQVFYYSTDVSVIIDCCEGFLCQLKENSQSGLDILITVLDGYYKSEDFKVTAVTIISDTNELSPHQALVSDDYSLLYQIPSGDNYIITLTVRGAKKITTVSSNVCENKNFYDITTSSATIARDSAFTIAFDIKGYEGYNNLSILFDKNLPVNTSIILIDKAVNKYWYYNFDSSVNQVDVNQFIEMGATANYVVSEKNIKLQFIIDFSKTDIGCQGENLSVSLSAEPIINNGLFPTLEAAQKTINLVDVVFNIEDVTTENQSLDKDLQYEFAVTSADSSKWNNKNAAIVVEPVDNLPADATIKVIQDSSTTLYYPNELGCYIIPVNDLNINCINISLESNLIPDEGKSYKVDIKFYASNSQVSKSPLNGVLVDQITTDIVFTAAPKEKAAIKITGDEYIINVGGTLDVNIQYILPINCIISSDLMRKAEDGEYSSSGARPVISGTGDMSISLAGLAEGSYCFRVIIKDIDGITVMSVPYYFIITNVEASAIK